MHNIVQENETEVIVSVSVLHSYGIVIWEILTQQKPYAGRTHLNFIELKCITYLHQIHVSRNVTFFIHCLALSAKVGLSLSLLFPDIGDIFCKMAHVLSLHNYIRSVMYPWLPLNLMLKPEVAT